MSDAEQTILSGPDGTDVPGAPQQPQSPKRDPRLIIAGIGCVLLLCAGVFIGAGILYGSGQLDNLLAGATEEPTATLTPTAAPTSTPTPEPTEEPASAPESDSGDTTSTDSGDAIETGSEPEIGSITFALDATEDYEPIEPGTSFEGEVTEIHAIFDYSGLSVDYIWEPVWYLDGQEMLRSAKPWSGSETGVFDYSLDAGGSPLPAGEWVLKIYVEDELLATDSFMIVGEEPAEVAEAPILVEETEEASEHEADLEPTATPTPTSAPVAPVAKTYKLAFTKWDGGKHLLFIGDTNGGSEQFILSRAAGPSWSPGGSQIFFFGEPGINLQDRSAFPGVGNCELPGISDGVMVIDVPSPPADFCAVMGSFYQGPGWNDGTARWASVSPDGSMVAYDAKPGGDYRIYFLGTADNQKYNYEILGEQADWSPDSEKIVYRSGRDGKTGIWISNRDDSGHTLITNGNDSFPTWSHDGKTIAFARDEDGNVDIYTANVDGTNVKRLTDTPGPDTLPIYTPNGEIIFRSVRSGSWSILKMSGSGSNQEELYPDAAVGDDWTGSKMSVLR